jgi:hypothetical protein
MPRIAGPFAWAGPILSILFIHVKTLRGIVVQISQPRLVLNLCNL